MTEGYFELDFRERPKIPPPRKNVPWFYVILVAITLFAIIIHITF